jgi:hypothetical protein
MTRRGRAVLALGFAVYLAAWIFGSRALYPVATGLLIAVGVAVVWVRSSNRPPQVRRHGAARDVVEGDDVRIDLELVTSGPAGSRNAASTCIAWAGLASRAATSCGGCLAAVTPSRVSV